jgi:cold shock CspA family protein
MNESSGVRQRGKIAKWYPDRGYGFVRRPDAQDVFVHAGQCPNNQNLAEGTEIEFVLITTNKGPQANGVTLVGGDGPVQFGVGHD